MDKYRVVILALSIIGALITLAMLGSLVDGAAVALLVLVFPYLWFVLAGASGLYCTKNVVVFLGALLAINVLGFLYINSRPSAYIEASMLVGVNGLASLVSLIMSLSICFKYMKAKLEKT